MEPDSILSMHQITKSFSGNYANRNIEFELRRGEIHALLGENGAGKTTLMKILYGLYKPDSGVIYRHGNPVNFTSPLQAIQAGIGMVHQHFMLIPPFTVWENIVLGAEPKRLCNQLDRTAALAKIAALSGELGLKIDPLAKVADLSVGLQQRVEILKALYREAEVLILDEPTAVLTPQEATELGQILRLLANRGQAIIFITHKLKEVKQFADRITVIRDGTVVATVPCSNASIESLAELMVGRPVALTLDKQPARPGPVVLKATGLTAVNQQKKTILHELSFEVSVGEILAFAGVDGNGQTELIEILTGLRTATQGSLMMENGNILNQNPRQLSNLGIAHIPEDRQRRGLVLDFTVWENIMLGRYRSGAFCRYGWLRERKCRNYAARLIKTYDIRTPHANLKVASLSGGNQQKLVVAREITRNPRLLIVAQPTRGLDVGAIEFVHQQLLDERDHGKAIILFSLELDEIMALADRIAVLYEGEIVGILPRATATEETLGLMMAGALRHGKPQAEVI